MSEVVSLNAYEAMRAAEVGMLRQIWAIRNHQKDKPSVNKREGWTIHIEGAAAELAFCKSQNILWAATVNTGKAPDVGRVYEVRRSIEHWYDLRIRKGDNPNLMYVCVTGQIPNFRIRGWIWGRDGMIEGNWTDPNGRGHAWFVPTDTLRSFDDDDFRARLPEEPYSLPSIVSVVDGHIRGLLPAKAAM